MQISLLSLSAIQMSTQLTVWNRSKSMFLPLVITLARYYPSISIQPISIGTVYPLASIHILELHWSRRWSCLHTTLHHRYSICAAPGPYCPIQQIYQTRYFSLCIFRVTIITGLVIEEAICGCYFWKWRIQRHLIYSMLQSMTILLLLTRL